MIVTLLQHQQQQKHPLERWDASFTPGTAVLKDSTVNQDQVVHEDKDRNAPEALESRLRRRGLAGVKSKRRTHSSGKPYNTKTKRNKREDATYGDDPNLMAPDSKNKTKTIRNLFNNNYYDYGKDLEVLYLEVIAESYIVAVALETPGTAGCL